MSELLQIGTLGSLYAVSNLPNLPAGLRAPFYMSQALVPGTSSSVSAITTSWKDGHFGRPGPYMIVASFACVTLLLSAAFSALYQRYLRPIGVKDLPAATQAMQSDLVKEEGDNDEHTRAYTVLLVACAFAGGVLLALQHSKHRTLPVWVNTVGSIFCDAALLTSMAYFGGTVGEYLVKSSSSSNRAATVNRLKQQSGTWMIAVATLFLTTFVGAHIV